jgi:hypothetical protein
LIPIEIPTQFFEFADLINGIFWQIDSRNVGEVKEGFSQLYYDADVLALL